MSVGAGGSVRPGAGPEGGTRLTAAPESGTDAGGTGGGRSLKNCALTGPIVSAGNAAASARASRCPQRWNLMSPLGIIALVFTENAANSSLLVHQARIMRTAGAPARVRPQSLPIRRITVASDMRDDRHKPCSAEVSGMISPSYID